MQTDYLVKLILSIILHKSLDKKLTSWKFSKAHDYRKGWVYPGNRKDETSDGNSLHVDFPFSFLSFFFKLEIGIARYTGLGPLIAATQQLHPCCYRGTVLFKLAVVMQCRVFWLL